MGAWKSGEIELGMKTNRISDTITTTATVSAAAAAAAFANCHRHRSPLCSNVFQRKLEIQGNPIRTRTNTNNNTHT